MWTPHHATLLQPIHGPVLLGLHTPGAHVHNLHIRIPQAPVEAQFMAGVGTGVGGGHGGPRKQVQCVSGVGKWQA